MRVVIVWLLGTAVLAGCAGLRSADPYPSPEFSRKGECERTGGAWHEIPSTCKYTRSVAPRAQGSV